MPAVLSLDDLNRTVDRFDVADLPLVITPAADVAVRRSLGSSGLLLLGEVHGVAENPLLIRAVMRELGIEGLALEWEDDLLPVTGHAMAGQPLPDHDSLWQGDGRLTAGHLAVLRDLATATRLELVLFEGAAHAGENGSDRDTIMARRILQSPRDSSGLLVVAGNAHTATKPHDLGVPLGAHLAAVRPGVQQIRIRYGRGARYSNGPRRLPPCAGMTSAREIRLHKDSGDLVLDLPVATEAIVPDDPARWPRPKG
jgi:hypothetical protein